MIIREQMPEIEGETGWINRGFTKEDLLDGKAVLIHFWSATDQTSKEAMPAINRLKEIHHARLNVAAVHVPEAQNISVEVIKREAELLGMSQSIFLDNDRKLARSFSVNSLPAYFLFDQEGNLRQFHAGPGGMERLEKWIERTIDYSLEKQ